MKVNEIKTFETIHDMLKWYTAFKCKPHFSSHQVQPVDAAVLSSNKSKNDSYHAALSSSPLLYLSQQSALKLRRPFTLILPCPLNSDKKGAGEETDRRALVSGTL